MSTSESPSGVAPHRGVLILVLGILSIVLCQILGPFAWIMGKGDLAKIQSGQMDADGRGLTHAGVVCGIIGTVVLAIWVALFSLVLIVTLASYFIDASNAAAAGP